MRHATRLTLNTAYTLVRMGMTVVLGLVATRLALSILGEQDFGIVGMLGAAGALLSGITESLNQSVMRHLAVEMGRKAHERVLVVFNTAIAAFGAIAGCVGVFALAAAYPIVHLVNIPHDRDAAAMWVLVATAVRLVVIIGTTPFRAMAMAQQSMLLLAIADILSSLCTLAAALALLVVDGDKMIWYAAMLAAGGIMVELALAATVAWRFPAARPRRGLARKAELRELADFGLWAFLGNVGWQLRNQGSQFILNAFYGLGVNASYSVALQAAGYQNSLSASVLNATSPLVMRSHGAGDTALLHRLTIVQGKYAAIFSLLFVVPAVLESAQLLPLWLKEVPPAADVLTPLMILVMWAQVLANSLLAPAMAAGNVGRMFREGLFVEIVGLAAAVAILWAVLPGVWLLPAVMLVVIVVQGWLRARFVAERCGLPACEWFRRAVVPVLVTAGITFAAAGAVRYLLQPGYVRLGLVLAATGVILLPAAWWLGMEAWERAQFRRLLGAARSRIEPRREANGTSGV